MSTSHNEMTTSWLYLHSDDLWKKRFFFHIIIYLDNVNVPHTLGTLTSLTGLNPTIVSYNASAVKIYSATGSLVRCEKQK
jgi:hypothetical protein